MIFGLIGHQLSLVRPQVLRVRHYLSLIGHYLSLIGHKLKKLLIDLTLHSHVLSTSFDILES